MDPVPSARKARAARLWERPAYLFKVFRYPRSDISLTGGNSPKLMEEKRKYPRTEINEPAYVSSGGSVMSCVVRNISPQGAAIDIENPVFVPQRFRLVLAKDSSVYECQIAWIQQKRIGVTFVAVPQDRPDPVVEA
jgi:hypothetical protein